MNAVPDQDHCDDAAIAIGPAPHLSSCTSHSNCARVLHHRSESILDFQKWFMWDIGICQTCGIIELSNFCGGIIRNAVANI